MPLWGWPCWFGPADPQHHSWWELQVKWSSSRYCVKELLNLHDNPVMKGLSLHGHMRKQAHMRHMGHMRGPNSHGEKVARLVWTCSSSLLSQGLWEEPQAWCQALSPQVAQRKLMPPFSKGWWGLPRALSDLIMYNSTQKKCYMVESFLWKLCIIPIQKKKQKKKTELGSVVEGGSDIGPEPLRFPEHLG